MGRKSNSNGSTRCVLLLLLLPLGSVLVTYKVYSTMSVLIHERSGHMQMVKQQLLDAISSRSRPAGPLVQTPADLQGSSLTKRFFHVAVTSDDIIYSQWQCRIMYYWYRQVKDGLGSEMGGFTRILHSGMPDDLMDEIPTFVVEPLPPDLEQVSRTLHPCVSRVWQPASSHRRLLEGDENGTRQKERGQHGEERLHWNTPLLPHCHRPHPRPLPRVLSMS